MTVAGKISIGVGAVLVVGFGASLVSMGGTALELAAKQIDQKKYPLIKTISEIFSKTLQTGPAALSLILLGSLFSSYPLAFRTTLGLGTTMVLTPLVNAVAHSPVIDSMNRTALISAKAINMVLFTTGIFMLLTNLQR